MTKPITKPMILEDYMAAVTSRFAIADTLRDERQALNDEQRVKIRLENAARAVIHLEQRRAIAELQILGRSPWVYQDAGLIVAKPEDPTTMLPDLLKLGLEGLNIGVTDHIHLRVLVDEIELYFPSMSTVAHEKECALLKKRYGVSISMKVVQAELEDLRNRVAHITPSENNDTVPIPPEGEIYTLREFVEAIHKGNFDEDMVLHLAHMEGCMEDLPANFEDIIDEYEAVDLAGSPKRTHVIHIRSSR